MSRGTIQRSKRGSRPIPTSVDLCGRCGKQRFTSEAKAVERLAAIREEGKQYRSSRVPFNYYYDPLCDAWHLTSRSRGPRGRSQP